MLIQAKVSQELRDELIQKIQKPGGIIGDLVRVAIVGYDCSGGIHYLYGRIDNFNLTKDGCEDFVVVQLEAIAYPDK